MTDLTLSLACTLSDRTRPILDGHIRVSGVRFIPLPGEPEEIFRRALRDRAFEVSELSMGSHIVTTARGDSGYVGVPVFPSRAFRHSGIFVRTDRGITRAEDLKGRRIGLPEYQQTAAMWVRGILADRHGVGPEDVTWVVGSQEQAGGSERVAVAVPPRIKVERIGPADTLNGLLASGDIDALVTPRPPSCFQSKGTPVDRLFPDYPTTEAAYFRETGFFPIMHCIAIRRDVAEAHPWLPVELFRAFAKAKAGALAELALVNVLRVSLPWVAAHHEATRAVLGPNPWPYGFASNREEIAAMTRYAASDGLAARTVDPAELFHPSTLAEADITG